MRTICPMCENCVQRIRCGQAKEKRKPCQKRDGDRKYNSEQYTHKRDKWMVAGKEKGFENDSFSFVESRGWNFVIRLLLHMPVPST